MDNRRISQLRAFTARVLGLFRSRKRDREFDEEMQAHLQLLVDRFVAQGMSQEDAAAAAVIVILRARSAPRSTLSSLNQSEFSAGGARLPLSM